MSLSILIPAIIIVSICVFVFTKTVSNDAKNDFKLRDILSNTQDNDTAETPVYNKQQTINSQEATVEKVYANNIYEELSKEETNQTKYSGYSTTTHDTGYEKREEKPNYNNNDTYYEKINDDACPDDDEKYIDEDEDYEDISYEKKTSPKKQKIRPVKTRNLFDYVKTFWRGVTFTVGAIVTVYSFIGLAYNVQTSNDALIFTLWLLIGVILIK
jgi:hypothetical protein